MSYNELTNGPTLRKLLEAFENKSNLRVTINGNHSMMKVMQIKWVEDCEGVVLITLDRKYDSSDYYYDLERRVGCTHSWELSGVG